MKALKIVLLVVFCLLFFGFNLVYITGEGVDNTLLSQSFYKKVIEDTNIVSAEKDFILEKIAEDIAGGQEESVNKVVLPALEESLSDEWMKKELLGVTGDIIPWLKGDKDELKSVIDLKDKKEEIIQNITARTEKMMEEGGYMVPGAAEGVRQGVRKELGKKIPEEVDIGKQIANLGIKPQMEKFQQFYKYFNFAPYVVYGLFFLLFLLLAGVWSGLSWLGGTVLASALVMLSLLFTLKGTLFTLVRSAEQVPAFVDMGLLEEIYNLVMTDFAQTASIFAGVGVVLILIGVLGKKFKSRQ